MSAFTVMVHIREGDEPRAWLVGAEESRSSYAAVRLDMDGTHVFIPSAAYLRLLIEQLQVVEAGLAIEQGVPL